MKNYPEILKELGSQMQQLGIEVPPTMQGFAQLHESAIKDGALSKKVKELMALSISITVRCDGCIAYHVHDSLQAGASAEEIHETIGMAILMGGGPSVVYGCEALEALKQFQKMSAK